MQGLHNSLYLVAPSTQWAAVKTHSSEVNFINVLRTAFMRRSQKRKKNTDDLTVFLHFRDLRAQKLHVEYWWKLTPEMREAEQNQALAKSATNQGNWLGLASWPPTIFWEPPVFSSPQISLKKIFFRFLPFLIMSQPSYKALYNFQWWAKFLVYCL